MDSTQITIGNKLENLPAVVSMVEAFGAEQGLPPTIVNALNLVLDEILSNVISHGYPLTRAGTISIQLSRRTGEVRAEVRDDGVSFDSRQPAAPDLSGTVQTRRVGGVGLLFVRELMDDLVYERVGDENRLVLIKKIPA